MLDPFFDWSTSISQSPEFGRVQNAAEETCLKEGPLQSPPTGDPSRQVDPCPTDEAIPVYGVVTGLTDTQAHATSNQLEIDQGERLPESEAVGPSEKPEVDPNTGLFARMRQGFRLDHRLGEPRVQAQARWFEKTPPISIASLIGDQSIFTTSWSH